MNSNTALARIVASWAQHPDPDLIRHALTTWDDRHSLATLCADADLDLPDDITELVLALIEADPLADRILDVLFTAALNNIPATDADLKPLTTAIRERPDCQAFQRLLAMSLTDLLLDDEAAAPEHVRERLAEAAAALGATLPSPEFAPVFLAYAAICPHKEAQARTMRLCWERAASLPDDMRYEISLELADLCDVEDDPQLALDVARTALQLSPRFGPSDPDPEDTVYLHVLNAEAVAATAGRPAAITYTTEAFASDPRLENTPLTESWTWNLGGHICALGLDDVPPSQVLPYADQLADHHDRWPSDPQTQASLAALLASAYLATNAPTRARPWVEMAVTHVEAVPDLAAEAVMLQVQMTFQEGRTEELDPLLRRAAQLIDAPGQEEHQLVWAMIVEAVSRVRRDPDLVLLAEQWLGRTIGALTNVTGGHAPEHLRAGLSFSQRLLSIHEQILTGDRSERIRYQVLALCEEIPVEHPQLIATAHVYACVLATGRGDSVEALEHLDQVTAVIHRLREDPPGGFPLVHLEQIEGLYRLLLADSTHTGSRLIPELDRLRQENEAAGRTDFAYMLTRGLMGIHATNDQPEAVIEEGHRALLFHTRRSTLIPDARERAALRGDLLTLAEEIFRATLQLNRTELAAELLEILRAQPVPLVRDEVPALERPLLGLLSKLIDNPTPASTRWTVPWSSGLQTAYDPAADSPEVDQPEDTALILAGLPTILMPWGPALNDLLRDPQAIAVARLTVPRTETG